MRWLANWLRQVFCRHEFKVEEISLTVTTHEHLDDYLRIVGHQPRAFKRHRAVVYQRCTKCGYHTSHDKY